MFGRKRISVKSGYPSLGLEGCVIRGGCVTTVVVAEVEGKWGDERVRGLW